MRYVLVTGSSGFVGQYVVRALLAAGFPVLGVSGSGGGAHTDARYLRKAVDLTDCLKLEKLFEDHPISHVVHLAAIAHVTKGMDDSWSRYYRVNTLAGKTLFKCAAARDIPVFFASTVDVYGVTRGEVTADTRPAPVGNYATSKYLAEEALRRICARFTIARFAPVYSDENRTDLRKRYCLRYPDLCYLIGRGKEYEMLSAENAAALAADWCRDPGAYRPVLNVCDRERLRTGELIDREKRQGRARHVLRIPAFAAVPARRLAGFSAKLSLPLSKLFDPIVIARDAAWTGGKHG